VAASVAFPLAASDPMAAAGRFRSPNNGPLHGAPSAARTHARDIDGLARPLK
jgi:hypothetical protein